MSKDFTFDGTLEATVGEATKKSFFDNIIENTLELDERLEGLGFLDGMLPMAGAVAVAYDGNGRVSTMTYTGNPAAVVTVVYDDANGGRVDYVEAVITDPVAATIRETYGYDGSNNVTSVTRTVA
mgnify:CR=1 FL=1